MKGWAENYFRKIGYRPVAACLLIILSCGCGHHVNKSSKKIFHLNLTVGVESLDPAFAKDLYSMWAVHMVYNTLVETDEHLHTIPSLAKRWVVSNDGLIYTFYLQNNICFQDNELFPNGKGRAMTAYDVVYSFERLIDPTIASTGAWIFNDRVANKDAFIAINDTTLQIRLRAPFRPLPQILSMPYCSIVPKEIATYWNKDFRSHPCGTGPFQFYYWDEGNVLILHKNTHYWEKDSTGNPIPYLDAVQISFFDSKATEFLLFLQGKLDFVNNIDGSFKDLILTKDGRLKKDYLHKFQLSKRTYLNTEYIGFQLDPVKMGPGNIAVSNNLVRQAINYAIDRQKIITYLRNGEGIAATSGFIPPGMPGYDSSNSFGYNYNPAKAVQLLAAAGYPNGKGLSPVTVFTPDNYSDVVNFIASELQDIGINMKVEIIQPAILKQQQSNGKVPMFRADWIADYPDAESFMAFFYSKNPAPPNYTRFNNLTFDKWYEESLNEPDTIRWGLYRKMDSLAMRSAPLIPLYYDELLHFTQNNITGFTSNPMNMIELKKVRITDK